MRDSPVHVLSQLHCPDGARPLTFPEIYVPHRPTLAKFRPGFWQIVCPGHRGTVRQEALMVRLASEHRLLNTWRWCRCTPGGAKSNRKGLCILTCGDVQG